MIELLIITTISFSYFTTSMFSHFNYLLLSIEAVKVKVKMISMTSIMPKETIIYG